MLHTWKFALAAALLLGGVSVASASSDSRSGGGYDIGPMGQCFVPSDCDQGRDQQGGGAYAYAYRYPRDWHYTPDYGWHYGRAR